jgi:hypothetical protein
MPSSQFSNPVWLQHCKQLAQELASSISLVNSLCPFGGPEQCERAIQLIFIFIQHIEQNLPRRPIASLSASNCPLEQQPVLKSQARLFDVSVLMPRKLNPLRFDANAPDESCCFFCTSEDGRASRPLTEQAPEILRSGVVVRDRSTRQKLQRLSQFEYVLGFPLQPCVEQTRGKTNCLLCTDSEAIPVTEVFCCEHRLSSLKE